MAAPPPQTPPQPLSIGSITFIPSKPTPTPPGTRMPWAPHSPPNASKPTPRATSAQRLMPKCTGSSTLKGTPAPKSAPAASPQPNPLPHIKSAPRMNHFLLLVCLSLLAAPLGARAQSSYLFRMTFRGDCFQTNGAGQFVDLPITQNDILLAA